MEDRGQQEYLTSSPMVIDIGGESLILDIGGERNNEDDVIEYIPSPVPLSSQEYLFTPHSSQEEIPFIPQQIESQSPLISQQKESYNPLFTPEEEQLLIEILSRDVEEEEEEAEEEEGTQALRFTQDTSLQRITSTQQVQQQYQTSHTPSISTAQSSSTPLHQFFFIYRNNYKVPLQNPILPRHIIRIPVLLPDSWNTTNSYRNRSNYNQFYFFVTITDPIIWSEYNKNTTTKRIIDLRIQKYIDRQGTPCRIFFYATGWNFPSSPYSIPTVSGYERFNVFKFVPIDIVEKLKEFTIASGGVATTYLWKRDIDTGQDHWIKGKISGKNRPGDKITIYVEGDRSKKLQEQRYNIEEEEAQDEDASSSRTSNIIRIT